VSHRGHVVMRALPRHGERIRVIRVIRGPPGKIRVIRDPPAKVRGCG
jgi:hypothetical protein